MSAANWDINVAYLKLVGFMPPSDIDALEAQVPGCVDAIAQTTVAQFCSMLRKRYSVIPDPVPLECKSRAAHAVLYQLFLRRGFNPSSAQDGYIRKAYEDAMAWLREASDPKSGLVVIGLAGDQSEKAVNVGGPLAYSEASPYTWMDQQRATLAQGGR